MGIPSERRPRDINLRIPSNISAAGTIWKKAHDLSQSVMVWERTISNI